MSAIGAGRGRETLAFRFRRPSSSPHRILGPGQPKKSTLTFSDADVSLRWLRKLSRSEIHGIEADFLRIVELGLEIRQRNLN